MFSARGVPLPGFLRGVTGSPLGFAGRDLSRLNVQRVKRSKPAEGKITRWLKWLAGTAFWLTLPAAALAAEPELRFGVFPQLSARIMVETYQPLANELGNSIKQPVSLESAPDFVIFHKRTLDGEYDLVLTAPHLAWLAWKEGGYRPILTYLEPARGVVIVRADSPYRQLPDLRGKTLALPDPLAVVNIRMEKILEKAGLRLGHELAVVETGSHTNAATHVSQGQADAAVVGVLAFLRLPKETRDKLRVIAESPAMPSHVYLVHPRAGSAKERAIAQAITQFTRSGAGQAFLQKGGFGGVRPLKKNELKQVEGDAGELKRRLQAQAQAGGTAK